MALRCFNPFVYEVVRRQSPLHGLTTPVDRLRDATLLTLIVFVYRRHIECRRVDDASRRRVHRVVNPRV